MASGVQWGFAVCMQCLQDYFLCFSINVNYKNKSMLTVKKGPCIPVETLGGSVASRLTSWGWGEPQFSHLQYEGVGLDNL